jgi:hypothetical protein
MSPSQAYAMAGSRWGVPLKVLTNKRALDLAFQQHIWTMQQQNEQSASRERQQKIAGEYGLKEREMMNRGSELKPFDKAASYATEILSKSDLIPGTQEYQSAWKNMFQTILAQMQGEQSGVLSLATGMPVGNPTGVPFDQNIQRPPMMVNPFSQDWENSVMSKWAERRKQKNAPKDRAVSSGATAYNPTTGERLIFRNGQWQKM